MAITWGATTLKIEHGKYQPWSGDNGLSIIPILPDGTTNPASIIQQAGRGRETVEMRCYVESYSDYTDLHDDYIALTERTFTDANANMSMIISDLSPATESIYGSKWNFRMTLMEVD